MTEATQAASKVIIGAPCVLYKLSSVSTGNTLTTKFGKVNAAFVSPIEATTPVYVSTSITGGTITFYNYEISDLDVLVWGV